MTCFLRKGKRKGGKKKDEVVKENKISLGRCMGKELEGRGNVRRWAEKKKEGTRKRGYPRTTKKGYSEKNDQGLGMCGLRWSRRR
jgi:hypothetical protein